ncbi:MAG: chemotaxis protein CheX [Candidatus Sulfotelmatobacter sp.]
MKPLNELLASSSCHEKWSPLLEVAAREVFELMLGCQLTASTLTEEATLEITSMVGLAGQMCGVLSLRCDGKSAALMASKMLGLEPDKVGPEMSDALGEVCNMIAGNFKNKISGMGDGCMLSVPTVIIGTDYNLYSQTDSPGVEVRLLFESRPIGISLQVRS